MVLNPYELLGASPNDSIQEVRKKYFHLASLCHPDRGGTDEQMRAVHTAYTYVVEQVKLNRTQTFEEVEREYEEFCKHTSYKTTPFFDVAREALFDDNSFNSASQGMERAFASGGYEVAPVQGSVEPMAADIIVYAEPMPLVGYTHARSIRDGESMRDFTCTVGQMVASDYCIAFSPPVPCGNEPLKDGTCGNDDVMCAYEEYLKARKNI